MHTAPRVTTPAIATAITNTPDHQTTTLQTPEATTAPAYIATASITGTSGFSAISAETPGITPTTVEPASIAACDVHDLSSWGCMCGGGSVRPCLQPRHVCSNQWKF